MFRIPPRSLRSRRSILLLELQSAPNFQSTKVINIAEMPFTKVTPPNEISADRSGMRVSEVHNQK